MARKVNADTLALIKQWEGFQPNAYPDPGSRDGTPWTIGYGTTKIAGRAIHKGEKITDAEATRLLQIELDRISTTIERLVKVDLTDNQFGALVSFTYNVGDDAFAKSTLLKKLNAGDYAAIPAQLARWNKNDGRVMPGLVNRRAAEAGLWAKGAHVASNTVDAKASGPAWVTPETMGAAGGLLTGAGGVASGSGPVQWAFGVVLVIAAVVVGYLIISKRINPK